MRRASVEITYRVRNGTRFFKDYDEFYWNVTGNDWPVPIDHASATVQFPAAAAGSLRAQAFTGVYGSSQRDATASVDGSQAHFETNNPLPMRGGLTIDVYIPKDILHEPNAIARFFWFIGGNPIVFLPLVTFAGMFALWWWKGRDPDPGVSVAPMYEPPAGISPAEAGTLLDDTHSPARYHFDHRRSGRARIHQDRRDVGKDSRLHAQRLRLSPAQAARPVGRRPGGARARNARKHLCRAATIFVSRA